MEPKANKKYPKRIFKGNSALAESITKNLKIKSLKNLKS